VGTQPCRGGAGRRRRRGRAKDRGLHHEPPLQAWTRLWPQQLHGRDFAVDGDVGHSLQGSATGCARGLRAAVQRGLLRSAAGTQQHSRGGGAARSCLVGWPRVTATPAAPLASACTAPGAWTCCSGGGRRAAALRVTLRHAIRAIRSLFCSQQTVAPAACTPQQARAARKPPRAARTPV